MKFLVLAAACLAVAVAGPTRGSLIPDSAGPILIPEEDISTGPALIPENIATDPALVPENIATDPALIPENISIGPALIDDAQKQSSLVQVIININSKSHVIEIPVEDATIPEVEDINVGPAIIEEIKPDPVDIVDESINVGVPDLPLAPSPADIGTPELPGLDADIAQNIPEELK
ncbi:unnamed protein product [Pieris macdunnoughi]|uniref:Uncharacterized protein n=1 Tax=Pieris macdunnoughi TaxID=345717 RepID=A0A821SVT3_9NEOP|nr:unnamed protein product [Pieris macdunnoughi]